MASRDDLFMLNLTPKNSNAPTFYAFGEGKNISLGGYLRSEDADEIERRFLKTAYSRDYDVRRIPQNHNRAMNYQMEQRMADREHNNLDRLFKTRMSTLESMYPEGAQPIASSTSNSPSAA